MATFGQFRQFGPFFSGGNLVAGAKIYHYIAGTNTLLNVYTDRLKTTPAAQPLVTDSQGIASCFADGIYKFVVADPTNVTDPPNIILYTFDNVNLSDTSSTTGKGANLLAASTLILGTDGNEFVVTGSTGITLISGLQSQVTLVFTGMPVLTTSANLLLAGAVNFVPAVNDVLTFVNEGLSGGNYIWREVSRTPSNFSTGDVKISLKTVADTGWVLMNDLTIGDASSGATGRANADTSALFALLWANIADQWAPVSTGRGASAVADFAAHKTLALPKTLGRALAGYGVGTTSETTTASSGNGFTVLSNNTKWVTGMAVVASAISGYTTTAANSTTYYVVRISATNIRLATTLALAQNLTPDITVSGSGSATFTYTFTSRAIGEQAGEEAHAQSVTELLAHTHTGSTRTD